MRAIGRIDSCTQIYIFARVHLEGIATPLVSDNSDSNDEHHCNAFDGYEKLIVVGMEALNIRHAIIKQVDAHGAHRASMFASSLWFSV